MLDINRLKQTMNEADVGMQKTIGNIGVMAQDARRVSETARNVHTIIGDIDRQFAEKTKLTKVDIGFLFLAVALQVARQYLISNFKERLGDQAAAEPTKELEKNIFGEKPDERVGRPQGWYNPTFEQVVFNPVPFDTVFGAPDFDLHIGGGFNHRASTLGHDAILGWIFGTMNIATSTLTTSGFQSYHVKIGQISTGVVRDKITNHADMGKIFDYSRKKLLNEGIEGKKIIGASLIKEAIHLKSDVNSKVGLPFPIISSAISPDFAKQVAGYGVDISNINTVFKQAAYAALINTIVAMVHRLLYDGDKSGSLSLYEVRTRKILSYSNAIASASNLIAVAIATVAGISTGNKEMVKKGLSYLDIGGLLVALYRIVTDYQFIKKIKQEFLEKEFYNIVMGDEFNF